MNDKTKLVVIYTRFSTDLQRDESCEDQERTVKQDLERKGIDVSKVVVLKDRAISGQLDSRPQFDQLKKMVEMNEVAILAVDEQSRLTRGDNAMSFIRDLVFHDARFISVMEGTDTDRRGWQETVKMAEVRHSMSSQDTSHRVRRGLVGRVLDGNGSAGDYPFGYRSKYIDEDWATQLYNRKRPQKEIVIHEPEAEVVRWIFKCYYEGWSLASIARDLNRRKVDTGIRGGKVWHRNRIGGILQNSKYIGIWTYGKSELVRNSHGKKRSRAARMNEPVTVKRPLLRIVEESLWKAVQKKRGPVRDRARHNKDTLHPHFRYPKFNIGGLVKCGDCGNPLHSRRMRSTRLISCRTCVDDHSRCSMSRQVRVADVEKAIYSLITDIYTNWPDWISQTYAETRKFLLHTAETGPAQLAERKASLEFEKKKLISLVDQVVEGGVKLQAIDNKIRDIQSNVDNLESEVAELEKQAQLLPELPDEKWLREQLKQLPEMLSEPSPAVAQLLKRMFTKAEIHKMPRHSHETGIQLRSKIRSLELFSVGMKSDMIERLRAWIPSVKIDSDWTSPEFVMDIGQVFPFAKWGQKIHEYKNKGYSDKEIRYETGLKQWQLKSYYKTWRKHSGMATPGIRTWQRWGETAYAMQQEGLTLNEISSRMGISYDTVTGVLRKWKIKNGIQKKPTIFHKWGDKMRVMRDKGMTWKQIEAETGISWYSACHAFSIERVKRRKKDKKS